MRRLSVLFLVPVLVFGLETVNLIKDHSFEKDDSVWVTRAGSKWGTVEEDSAQASRHDPESFLEGAFSASCDTKTPAAWFIGAGFDSAMVVYSFDNKKIEDLDSLIWNQKVIGYRESQVLTLLFVTGLFLDASSVNWFQWGYSFENPDFNFGIIDRWQRVSSDMPDDTLWEEYARNLKTDLGASHDPQSTVDSFLLLGWGSWYDVNKWYGQKVYWDGIRLMGYADYDVGVKEIISEASFTVDTPYVPMARIKNFGRENADSFLVIAVIEDSTFIAYIDTLPWSLEGDTEDTVTFAEFIPFYPFEHVLTVYTVMTPDESDADDRLSLNLFCSVCHDSPEFPGTSMELLNPITPNYLRVSYALPVGQLGIISVYDAAGRIQYRMNVRGVSEVTITADLTPGVYFIRLDAGDVSVTHKAVVLR